MPAGRQFVLILGNSIRISAETIAEAEPSQRYEIFKVGAEEVFANPGHTTSWRRLDRLPVKHGLIKYYRKLNSTLG